MLTEVSSSVPHFLQVGLVLSPIIYDTFVKALSAILIPQYGLYSGNDKNICITVPVVMFGQEHLFLNNILLIILSTALII
jgi:hypothetical protein